MFLECSVCENSDSSKIAPPNPHTPHIPEPITLHLTPLRPKSGTLIPNTSAGFRGMKNDSNYREGGREKVAVHLVLKWPDWLGPRNDKERKLNQWLTLGCYFTLRSARGFWGIGTSKCGGPIASTLGSQYSGSDLGVDHPIIPVALDRRCPPLPQGMNAKTRFTSFWSEHLISLTDYPLVRLTSPNRNSNPDGRLDQWAVPAKRCPYFPVILEKQRNRLCVKLRLWHMPNPNPLERLDFAPNYQGQSAQLKYLWQFDKLQFSAATLFSEF